MSVGPRPFLWAGRSTHEEPDSFTHCVLPQTEEVTVTGKETGSERRSHAQGLPEESGGGRTQIWAALSSELSKMSPSCIFKASVPPPHTHTLLAPHMSHQPPAASPSTQQQECGNPAEPQVSLLLTSKVRTEAWQTPREPPEKSTPPGEKGV